MEDLGKAGKTVAMKLQPTPCGNCVAVYDANIPGWYVEQLCAASDCLCPLPPATMTPPPKPLATAVIYCVRIPGVTTQPPDVVPIAAAGAASVLPAAADYALMLVYTDASRRTWRVGVPASYLGASVQFNKKYNIYLGSNTGSILKAAFTIERVMSIPAGGAEPTPSDPSLDTGGIPEFWFEQYPSSSPQARHQYVFQATSKTCYVRRQSGMIDKIVLEVQ